MNLILDVGCGNRKYEKAGFLTIGMDYIFKSHADVIADLERMAVLPFKDNSFSYIHFSHVLEHFSKPVDVMKDIRRIAKCNSIVLVKVPHHSSVRSFEIFHKTLWNYFSFDTLCSNPGADAEEKLWFNMKSRNIVLQLSRGRFKKIGRMIENIINCFPYKYESFFYHFLPAYEICFELEVVK